MDNIIAIPRILVFNGLSESPTGVKFSKNPIDGTINKLIVILSAALSISPISFDG